MGAVKYKLWIQIFAEDVCNILPPSVEGGETARIEGDGKANSTNIRGVKWSVHRVDIELSHPLTHNPSCHQKGHPPTLAGEEYILRTSHIGEK